MLEQIYLSKGDVLAYCIDTQKENVSINKYAIKQGIIEFFLGVLLVAGGICTFVEFVLISMAYLFALFLSFCFYPLASSSPAELTVEYFEVLISVFHKPYFWIGVLLLILRYILDKINKKYENMNLKKL